MALSDVELNLGAGGAKIGVDLIGGIAYEVVKVAYGVAGAMTPVDTSSPLPVTDADATNLLSSIDDLITNRLPASLGAGGGVKVDGSGTPLPISGGVSITSPTVIYNGKKTVTTAGTRVTLASSQAIKSVCIKALQTNSGYIYVGDGSVSSTTGIQLLAGDTVSLDISNLATVYLDSSVNGEGVTYISTN